MTPARHASAADLSGFAPDFCSRGHDLRVRRGNRAVSFLHCDCPGMKADPKHRIGHIEVTCTACRADGVTTRFYDPPHAEQP